MIANGEQAQDLLTRVGVLSDTLERVIRERRLFPADMPAVLEITGLIDHAKQPGFSKDTALRILAVTEPLMDGLRGFEEENRKVPAALIALHLKVQALRTFVDSSSA